MMRIRVDARAAGRLVLLALVLAVMVPSLAAAQSIAGVVRDSSGAVLPGVTVEAASPALIEKVRSGVSDGSGQYRIENLAPGIYKITYSLTGFANVEREGVQVSTGVTLTLNADMRVGGVQESITVSGETPVVDVQNSTRVQRCSATRSSRRCRRRAATGICWRPSRASRPTPFRTAAPTRG